MTKQPEFKVIIPQENYSIVEFKRDNLPAIAVINTAIKDFEPKIIFGWHLSIILDFNEMVENGMPSKQEQAIVDSFGDKLNALIKGEDKTKPNALFVGRITWNKTRQFIWRVHNPEIANNTLKQIIDSKDYPRHFDYRMQSDQTWDFAKGYFKGL
jgi:hypothetical protein